MHIECSDEELVIFNKIAMAAAEMNVSCFIIGGFVRDKIIGRPTSDADIVCTGDGIHLAHAVANHFHPIPPVSFFKNFAHWDNRIYITVMISQILLNGFFRSHPYKQGIPAHTSYPSVNIYRA
jgi:tRNA nucleotidyltransferase/poly(A) polymerase